MQVAAVVVCLAVTAVAIALFARAAAQIVGVVRIGRPAAGRTDGPGARTATMLAETLGHTRMLQWGLVGTVHWVVFVGFGFLFFTLVTAYGQLFDPEFALPLIGHWLPYEWFTELIAWTMLASIGTLVAIRVANRPAARGRRSRLFGSTMWQGYFVEAVILGIGLCILALRGLEYALIEGDVLHFPFTFFLGEAFSGLADATLATLVHLVAMLKIVISFTWMITSGVLPRKPPEPWWIMIRAFGSA